ncbi:MULTISPECIES: YlbG family protein [unclassified Staphylococcus]|uniref:YlbG family protein n=1 Tax=unclassified Staphylococcus TaxID=91994 RepID=UPI0021CF1268|nr:MULTISPECIES: YlbG family protein [unclassified Staphylococcus]UXR78987.1 YlbG family protein [Staphylococcus sp. IVB6227]UXR83503.1 YlbG family protein [Staphylococcus sp. IVB6214]
MEIVQREKLIVYLKNMKHERHIRKYGHIVYSNKQLKYVYMYVDTERVDEIVDKLNRLKYVTNIMGSPYKTLKKVYDKEKHEELN